MEKSLPGRGRLKTTAKTTQRTKTCDVDFGRRWRAEAGDKDWKNDEQVFGGGCLENSTKSWKNTGPCYVEARELV